MKPKKVMSPWVCPNCGGRATKIVSLNKEKNFIKCQQCEHEYDPPAKAAPAPCEDCKARGHDRCVYPQCGSALRNGIKVCCAIWHGLNPERLMGPR